MEDLQRDVRLPGLEVSAEGEVEEGFGGRWGEVEIRVEEGVGEGEWCTTIGGCCCCCEDVGDEERFGVGEFVVGDERADEGEKGERGVGWEGFGGRGFSPVEEGEEGFGSLGEGRRGEEREEERLGDLRDVWI